VQQDTAGSGHDRLGMKLDPLNGQGPVPHAHQFALISMRSGLEAVGQSLLFHHQGMIPHAVKRVDQSGKHAKTVMVDGAGFSMHQPGSADDPAAKNLAYGLMAETDSENGNAAAEKKDGFHGNTGLLGCAGPGEISNRSGDNASISLTVIVSLRKTLTSGARQSAGAWAGAVARV
jgi:hypothetical protein